MDITGAFGFTTNIRINGSKAAVEKREELVFYGEEEPKRIDLEGYDPYAKETEYFAECVQKDLPVERVPNEDVVYVLRILHAIQQSLEEGKIVFIE